MALTTCLVCAGLGGGKNVASYEELCTARTLARLLHLVGISLFFTSCPGHFFRPSVPSSIVAQLSCLWRQEGVNTLFTRRVTFAASLTGLQ